MESDDVVGARFEWMSRDEIESFQIKALRQTVAQASKSPWYSAKFREIGLGTQGYKVACRCEETTIYDKRRPEIKLPNGYACRKT